MWGDAYQPPALGATGGAGRLAPRAANALRVLGTRASLGRSVRTAQPLPQPATVAPQVGRTAEAAAGFRAAVSVQPDGAEAYYNLGIAYKDQGRHRDSLDAYNAALALRPTFPEASFNAGRALQMLSDEPGPLGLLTLSLALPHP